MTDQTQLITAALVLANTLVTGWMYRNVKKIEVATNSMKDTLVKATGDQKLLEGIAQEKARAKAEKSSNAIAISESQQAEKQNKP